MSNMLCPKCGKFQEKADICDACGIAVAKFNAKSIQQSLKVRNTSKQNNSTSKVPIFMGAVIVIAVIFNLSANISSGSSTAKYTDLPVLDKERSGKGIKQYEFMSLFDANKPFSSLAKEEYYTVVEGYLDTCSICRRLEADFPVFLKARKDVHVRRVHFPEGGMHFSFTGTTQVEVDAQAEEYNQRIKSYDFCGTPHIEIYNSKKELIIADSCAKRPATDFLRKWMSAET